MGTGRVVRRHTGFRQGTAAAGQGAGMTGSGGFTPPGVNQRRPPNSGGGGVICRRFFMLPDNKRRVEQATGMEPYVDSPLLSTSFDVNTSIDVNQVFPLTDSELSLYISELHEKQSKKFTNNKNINN